MLILYSKIIRFYTNNIFNKTVNNNIIVVSNESAKVTFWDSIPEVLE